MYIEDRRRGEWKFAWECFTSSIVNRSQAENMNYKQHIAIYIYILYIYTDIFMHIKWHISYTWYVDYMLIMAWCIVLAHRRSLTGAPPTPAWMRRFFRRFNRDLPGDVAAEGATRIPWFLGVDFNSGRSMAKPYIYIYIHNEIIYIYIVWFDFDFIVFTLYNLWCLTKYTI